MKMNFFFKPRVTSIRQYTSLSQIKLFFNKVKFTEKVRKHSSMSYKNLLFLNASRLHKYRFCCLHNDSGNIENDIDDVDDITDFLPYDDMLQHQSIRNLLHPNSGDPLILKMNDCASLQEILNVIKENASKMQLEHISQAVLVVWDLQKMFFYAHQINKPLPVNNMFSSDGTIQDYVSQLISHPEFCKLLELIQINQNEFDMESLSCILLYLNKLGLSIKHELLQLLISRLSVVLETDISLSALSRFIVTIFSEQNLGSFFVVKDALPIIIEELEKCKSPEDLKLITICLNHLHQIITVDMLQQYKDKVKELIGKNIVTSKDYRTILKAVMFLSYPQWSDRNAVLISEMMLLLKNNLHTLGIFDFFIAYEVFYKNHEPGELLTEIQRCASKLLLQLDEDYNLPLEIRLKLLSCIVCFSSSRHRPEYEKTVAKYVKDPLTKSSMFDLLRILTFIKPNTKLCEAFWDSTLKTVETSEMLNDSNALLKLCQKYMNYSSDVHYRHERFEQWMINWLQEELKMGILHLIPSKFSMMAAFIFAYGNDEQMVDYTVQKITQMWEQFNHADCLYIAKGLRSVAEITRNQYLTTAHLNVINDALDRAIYKKLINAGDGTKVNFLLKSCIYRKHFDRNLVDTLLLTFKNDQILSSNSVRNIIFSLQSTNGLLPDIIDNIANYAINNRDHLLGFNAEKITYLCYFLGYLPKQSDELFQAVTNVLLRDQERISGLSYIQAALSLCFFNKLPDSFIKQIFNVTFLEKLDTELATCYFKGIYPIRVRHSLMQLNRAVCLDYPQSNVPWFHQKYIEQLQNKDTRERRREMDITSKIKAYLIKIAENPNYLLQDIYTAYGYHVDFLIHVDKNGQFIKPNENEDGTRIAILLMKSKAYTNINVQLKGQYQLKKRHLEILGYRVLNINLNEWNSLVYGEEKMEYFSKLIKPTPAASQSYYVIER